jgi:hypothetical protein
MITGIRSSPLIVPFAVQPAFPTTTHGRRGIEADGRAAVFRVAFQPAAARKKQAKKEAATLHNRNEIPEGDHTFSFPDELYDVASKGGLLRDAGTSLARTSCL